MKETIVIIRGANYLKSNSKTFQKIILGFYKMFNIVPVYSKQKEKWVNALRKCNREIIYFRWSGSFWQSEVLKHSKILKELIKNKKNVKIISVSLGTQIAINVAKNSNNVVKIISIGGVYKPTNISIPFIDIRFIPDNFSNFFRELFWFFSLSRKMLRQEILLHGAGHDDLHDNIKITNGTFKGKNISYLLNYFLKSTPNLNSHYKKDSKNE